MRAAGGKQRDEDFQFFSTPIKETFYGLFFFCCEDDNSKAFHHREQQMGNAEGGLLWSPKNVISTWWLLST